MCDKLHQIVSDYTLHMTIGWRELDHFKFGLKAAQEYRPTISEIEKLFNDILHKEIKDQREYWLVGCFISGVYREVLDHDDAITLCTVEYHPQKVAGLGYRHLRGDLEIIGDTGWWTGRYMQGGEIIIEGNAGHRLGAGMRGGRIVVEGDAEFGVGEFMKDGEIVVKGNARWIGNEMKGGKIHIMGRCEEVSGTRRGGEILS